MFNKRTWPLQLPCFYFPLLLQAQLVSGGYITWPGCRGMIRLDSLVKWSWHIFRRFPFLLTRCLRKPVYKSGMFTSSQAMPMCSGASCSPPLGWDCYFIKGEVLFPYVTFLSPAGTVWVFLEHSVSLKVWGDSYLLQWTSWPLKNCFGFWPARDSNQKVKGVFAVQCRIMYALIHASGRFFWCG